MDEITFLTNYNSIIRSIKIYSRNNNPKEILKWSKFTGLIGKFVQDKKYKIYRGLSLTKDPSYTGYYNIEKAVSSRVFEASQPQISWTSNLNIADGFARGKTHWMDSYHYDPGKYGIIIEWDPSLSEILIDLEFSSNNYGISWDFPEEEIICIPKIKKFKIKKIIDYSDYLKEDSMKKDIYIKKDFRIPGTKIILESGDKIKIKEANSNVSTLENFIKKVYKGNDKQIGKDFAIDAAHALSNVSQESFDSFVDEIKKSYL